MLSFMEKMKESLMPSLVFTEKCTRCGLCAADCPRAIIAVGADRAPSFIAGGETVCIACGHCEAICPEQAVFVVAEGLAAPVPSVELSLDRLALAGYLRSRRSIRQYRRDAVERNVFEQLFDVVRYAPSGVNRQPVRWLVVTDPAETRRLAGLAIDWLRELAASDSPLRQYFDIPAMVALWESGGDPILRNAPHLVVAHAHKDQPTAAVDGIIALAHLDIAAPSFGLGTCWAGLFQIAVTNWRPLADALALPDGHVSLYAMMLGFPAVRYGRPPRRNSAFVTYRHAG